MIDKSGDVAGVRIATSSLTVPPTPPPDVDLDAWHQSLERVAAWKPERLAMTHFGESTDVQGQLSELGRRLDDWAQLARAQDAMSFAAHITEEIQMSAEPELLEAYIQAAPPEQLFRGLERYWRKRAEAAASRP